MNVFKSGTVPFSISTDFLPLGLTEKFLLKQCRNVGGRNMLCLYCEVSIYIYNLKEKKELKRELRRRLSSKPAASQIASLNCRFFVAIHFSTFILILNKDLLLVK